MNLEANLYSESILNPNNGAFTVLHGAGLGEDPDLDVIKTYLKNKSYFFLGLKIRSDTRG